MAKTNSLILLLCTLASLVSISSAVTCSNYSFPSNQVFGPCIDLPVLQASLHWNYSQLTTKVLLALRHGNGSMIAYSTSITSYNPSMLPGELGIPVSAVSAEYVDQRMIIFGVLGPLRNQTSFNHVLQCGSTVSENIPQVHPLSGQNVESMGLVNFLSWLGQMR